MATNAALRNPAETVDQVFLSPRVLDRTAFEEFGAALQGLIHTAAAQAHAVEAAVERAAQVQSRLADHGPGFEARFADAAASLAAAESRSTEAQAMLTQAAQHLADARGFEHRVGQIIEDRLSVLHARIAEAEAHHQIRLRAIADDARAYAESAGAGLHVGLDHIDQRARELDERINGLAARMAALCGADDRAEAILRTAAMAEEARGSLAQASLDAVGTIERCMNTRDALRAELAIVSDRIRALQGNLSGVVREAREAAVEIKPVKRRAASTAKARPAQRRKARRAA